MMSQDVERCFSLAVIADAHVHDIEGDYGVCGIETGGRRLTLQTWAHSRESTRVFNESAAAFDLALATVAERGIRHVLLLGDYTDDGQRRTTDSVAGRLAQHEAQFGTRFYALPGNHDMFGPRGRHQSRYFLQDGGDRVLVSSDGRDPLPGTIVTPLMYCHGVADSLAPMARHGYFRRDDDLHWESPFGRSDALEDRIYDAVSQDGQNRHPLVDASYLVEPEDGLWLLMIDANVFEPRNGQFKPGSKGAFIDSTAAGWNAMLRVKPFIFGWIRDVSARARAQGKVLLTFSHYPVVSPFHEAGNRFEQVLFPKGVIAARIPQNDVADALIDAGVPLHFSGHWHVNSTSQHSHAGGMLTNIAVPSLVAFPPVFDVVTVKNGQVSTEAVDLSAMPLDVDIMTLYRQESAHAGLGDDAALSAENYGDFLCHHTRALVVHRYMPREWPGEVVDVIAAMRVSDLIADPRTAPASAAQADIASLADAANRQGLDVVDVLGDWYLLRQGGAIASTCLGARRIALLRALAQLYRQTGHSRNHRPVARYLETVFQSLIFCLDEAARQIRPVNL